MTARSICVGFALAILLVLAAPSLWAQDGLPGAVSQTNLAAPFDRSLAVADFDNDQKPDGAVLVGSGGIYPASFRIELHLTAHENTELAFESSQTALELVALDIDHDGDTDVIVQQAFTHQRLSVWINDGHGTFHEGRLQDFPSVALVIPQSLSAPADQPEVAALGLPSQRGFEIAILTLPLLSRPPTTNRFRTSSPAFSAASYAVAANSSRAPPLS